MSASIDTLPFARLYRTCLYNFMQGTWAIRGAAVIARAV